MSHHPSVATLMSLELGALNDSSTGEVASHLSGCESCRERREEVRHRLGQLAGELRGELDETSHVPRELLAQFVSKPAGLGGDAYDAIQSHLARCPSCREEETRLRAAEESAWARAETAARSVPARHRSPRRFRSWSLLALPLAVAALALFIVRSGGRGEQGELVAAMPVRLLGSRDVSGGTPVTMPAPGEPLVLLVKLPAAAAPGASYELRMTMDHREVRRPISPNAIDDAGVVAVVVPRTLLVSGKTVEVTVHSTGAGGDETVFRDMLAVEPRSP